MAVCWCLWCQWVEMDLLGAMALDEDGALLVPLLVSGMHIHPSRGYPSPLYSTYLSGLPVRPEA
jgi:hypothetical protein